MQATQVLEQTLLASKDSLYRLAYSYVHNQSDAMDVVQEAAYKALRSKRQPPDPEAMKPWLCRIVINAALDMLRRGRHETTVEEMPDPGREDDHRRAELLDAMGVLDERSRTALILRYFEDMKVADVAAAMGENVNTIKSLLRRALQLLKTELGQEDAADENIV